MVQDGNEMSPKKQRVDCPTVADSKETAEGHSMEPEAPEQAPVMGEGSAVVMDGNCLASGTPDPGSSGDSSM